MEGVNSFEKGLHRSNSPQMQPEGSYVDALNWIRNDSGRLVNEELEEVIKELTDAKGYEFLGSCPVNNSFVCFFKQNANDGNFYSEIGVFENGVYTRVFNDFFTSPTYFLNFNKPIDSVARIVSTGDTVIYFVEEGNPPRRFNLTAFQKLGASQYTNELYNTVEDWNLQLTFKMPYATYSVERNGTLPTGTYSFAFRYATNENNKTTFNIPSRFFNIANDSQDNNDTVTGDLPQTSSNQNIVMSLQNLDTNYPFVEVVVITYLGLTNVLSIKSLGLFENRNDLQINFNSASQYLQDVSESALLEMPININSATCIEQKDNILILSNITSKKFDVGFQKDVANNIKLYWIIEQVPVDNRRNITGVRQGGSLCWPIGNNGIGGINSTRRYGKMYGTQDRPSASRDQNFQQSNVYQNPQILKGFQRGEVYSFSITPIYKDGSVGFAYHIPGNTILSVNEPRLNFWESDYDYTQMYKDAGLTGKIRHHQMPDYNETGYIGNADYINILKVQAANINFTDEQKANIQGYIIGYQPRNSDLNTRIIDNGFSRPYLKNEYSDKYIGTLWTGSVTHVEKLGSNDTDESRSSYTWSTNWSNNQEYAMYHSPDSLLDKQKIKAAYKIERVGYGNNLILHAGNSGLDSIYFEQYTTKGDVPYYVKMTLPICTNNAPTANSGYLYTNMFFEFNEFVSNKGDLKNIDSAEFVPFIADQNPITIDNKISITYSSEYIHLKTNGSHFFDNTSNAQSKYFLDPQYFISQLEGHQNQNGALIHNPSLNRANDNSQRIGINLSRIVNENPQQYGTLDNAEYTPAVVILGDSNSLPTRTNLEGDVYISKYFFNIFDKLNGRTSNETIEGHSMMGIYVESKNNYALRHTENGKVPFYPNYKYFVSPSTDTTTPGMFNLDWYKVTTGYNKQYSSLTGVKLNFPKPLFFNETTAYNNRSIYSNQSFESELVDQYRIFSANSFHDIPRHRGVIKDTFVFNNNFFHHTEYGLWLSYFNPNTIQSTTQGDVVLGNAGIFRIPSKLILDIKGGYMGTNDKSGTNTPFGRVFLDHYQGKIFLFAGESPIEISDLGLFSFFREFVNTNDEYTMGYDWANKRLLINNITQEKAISYYPKTETWTSLHNFSPNGYLTLNGASYAWKNSTNSFYNLNNINNIRKESYITLITNASPDNFKRFDRMELNTMSGGNAGINSPGFVEPNNYIFNDRSFSTIHCWTDRQNTTELPLAYSDSYEDNFLNGYDVDKIPVNYYRSSFHLELPLDAVVDPYKNIFDDRPLPNGNLDINADFRAHMKAKFLYTKLSYKDMIDSNGNIIKADKPLVLNYVKTFFKPTVA